MRRLWLLLSFWPLAAAGDAAPENVQALAADPDVVAVLTGKYSPVVEELLPVVHRYGLPLIAPWSASDSIVDNGRSPNFDWKAGTTDRSAIRDALEGLGPYEGLVRAYRPPFTPARHEALRPEDVFLARFDEDGTLVPAERRR